MKMYSPENQKNITSVLTPDSLNMAVTSLKRMCLAFKKIF